jgi:hypothetical protein
VDLQAPLSNVASGPIPTHLAFSLTRAIDQGQDLPNVVF